MKKFLSLVLALVMTMSLVTVSAGAKDFTDSSKITYSEAVDVMSAVKVIDGYAEGDFRPTATLTRGAAAKIICNLILGPTTASALVADAAPYKDVPTNHTFAGYIAYCQKEGIISGYADGTFKPAATLTGYAFMKMLLGALGYDSAIEGYTGANWSIAVAKQAINAGLNKSLKGSFNGVKAVTREEACLYAFNTLKATMVEYDNRIVVGEGSSAVAISGVRKDLTWNKGTLNDGKIKKDGYVQFGEQYFEKLVRTDDTDDFGRPTNNWTYDKKDIGNYVNTDLLTASYTAKVKGGDVYSDIGSNACDFALTYWVDGVKLDKKALSVEADKLVKKNDDTFDKNNVITEMEAQAYTAAKNWNTKQYKDDGYAFLNVANKSELTAKGATLWIDDAASNDKYILLDEDCKIFVRASDDDEDDYTEYSNIKSALSALGEDSNFTGTIAAFVDDAGIATTLILNDTYKANDKPNTNPSKPTSTDVDSVKLTIKGSKGLIELFNKKGDALTDGTVKHTFELYQYVAGQNNYVKVDEGDYFYGVTPAFSVAGGNSYYVVIDGVQSNIARA